MREKCALCGKPAEGFAFINEHRFCHPDDPTVESCYMAALARMADQRTWDWDEVISGH